MTEAHHCIGKSKRDRLVRMADRRITRFCDLRHGHISLSTKDEARTLIDAHPD